MTLETEDEVWAAEVVGEAEAVTMEAMAAVDEMDVEICMLEVQFQRTTEGAVDKTHIHLIRQIFILTILQ